MEAAVSDRLEAAYVTLLMLGLRPGELLGWHGTESIWRRACSWYGRRSKVERSTMVVLGPLKTAGARRTLALPMLVAEALRRHRVRQDDERSASGAEWARADW
ncbi:MAG: hypothetical protein M3083_12540 [Actinomycetota bacterium]|nr:hypothetical protein [Actinomycetota bacterium]